MNAKQKESRERMKKKGEKFGGKKKLGREYDRKKGLESGIDRRIGTLGNRHGGVRVRGRNDKNVKDE